MAVVEGTNKAAWDSKTNPFLNTQRATGMPQFESGNPSTLPITSTNINVFSNNMRIGFVQSFSPSEQRTITKVQELGTEGVVQSVPGNTNGGQIAITRLAVYNAMLFNALGMTPHGKFSGRGDQDVSAGGAASAITANGEYRTYGNPFKTLKDQRVPLEIRVQTIMPDQKNTYYVESYIDCWLSNYSRTIQTSQITVSEQATIQYSDVMSGMATDDNVQTA